ncbi:MAG: RsmD family RNA methyltransferase, partial [Ignavibacteria bacterium]|nr:RsmD family RNA methyltransferase [Ignavibacteria bacterium]
DLILADPPFFKFDIHDAVKNLLERNYLNEDGLIIIERSIQTKKEDEAAFGVEAFKKIGDSLIYQFEKSSQEN